jgi:hypothetical protein
MGSNIPFAGISSARIKGLALDSEHFPDSGNFRTAHRVLKHRCGRNDGTAD